MKYKKGDLIKAALDGEVDVIAHQCNCFNNMGAGIAPQIAKAFWKAEDVDSRSKKGDTSKLGDFTVAIQHNVIIFNLYGQYRYGRGGPHTDYKALEKSLIRMKNWLGEDHKKEYKIGFPKIGCGLGGGDWSIVEKMIDDIFDGWDVTVYEL